jgi:hypothetical protein
MTIRPVDLIREEIGDLAAYLRNLPLSLRDSPYGQVYQQRLTALTDELEGQRTGPFTVQGLNWPATLGDFTLVGPVNDEGAWRWYERYHNGTTERIKVDHQLHPLGSPHHQ